MIELAQATRYTTSAFQRFTSTKGIDIRGQKNLMEISRDRWNDELGRPETSISRTQRIWSRSNRVNLLSNRTE